MIRVLLSLSIVGASYLCVLALAYFLIAREPPSSLSLFLETESLLLILASLISLGLVQDASRKIALDRDSWEVHYQECQSQRLSIALFIFCATLILFVIGREPTFLVGIAALPVALSGEYALYARGLSVQGSTAALIKNIAFAVGIFVISTSPLPLNFLSISIAFCIAYLVSGFYASRKLKKSYIVFPKKIGIRFLKVIGPIVLAVFIYNNFKPAFVFFLGEHLTDQDKAYYFEFFKLFFVAFALRRSLTQILYKKIINNPFRFQVDLVIGIALSLFCMCAFVVYQINLKLSIHENFVSKSLLVDTIISVTLMSIFPTSFTKLFSLKRDRLLFYPIVFICAYLLSGSWVLNALDARISYYVYLLASCELFINLISLVVLRLSKNVPDSKTN